MTSYTLDEPCADAVLEAMADGRERTLNDIARLDPPHLERLDLSDRGEKCDH